MSARITALVLVLTAPAALTMPAVGAPDPQVAVWVDAAHRVGALPPIWRFFGADEPNYGTEPQGRKLLMELGGLRPGQVFFRAHNLMTTGDGVPDLKWGSTNLYTEKKGQPVYDWTLADGIIDTYVARGVHPYLELGFMPEAMSAALHNVARYGRAEVERWYFEVWNEPNLAFYWSGTAEEFYRLHDLGIDAVRRALPTARVGGPDVAGAGGAFMDGFLAHLTTGTNYATGSIGTPTDFISFHAKGQPILVDGHVRMGMATQLKTVDEGFAKIAAVPALVHKPIIIGRE